ncbi:hypothetical protein C6Y40_13110 [Alteromonas alba]|uniref:Uncharacterized protein n=1 Tax=Alteromonas alba TaxID=2079529 RepID=A0A2S9V9I0_9ALTE|nr:hypothetical protein C6Y40_13110 [Alteromonas alba]|tara:strand:+ start:702 stop:893 length:192 start_codon:yes stop_codon:yes gene_type:complete
MIKVNFSVTRTVLVMLTFLAMCLAIYYSDFRVADRGRDLLIILLTPLMALFGVFIAKDSKKKE